MSSKYEINKRYKTEKVGEINTNTQGCQMKIIEYKEAKDIIVEFQDNIKYQKKTSYNHFLEGKVKNPYFNSVYGVGYLGDINNINRNAYKTWLNMLRRCYNEKYKKNNVITYKDVIVCDEWLCYKNFEKWFDENYYSLGSETMCLDKDILNKKSNIYSPQTCLFVPLAINDLFIYKYSQNGMLSGVSYTSNKKKYRARISINNKEKFIGSYDNEIDAFNSYIKEKEKNIKTVANKYKQKYPNFPQKLYNAMCNYKIDISDCRRINESK